MISLRCTPSEAQTAFHINDEAAAAATTEGVCQGTSRVVQRLSLPCIAGDAGWIPSWGPNIPHAAERLSPNATARETARRSKEPVCGSQTNDCFLEEFVGQGVTNSGTCLAAANKMQRKKVKPFSRVWLFATPWTVACQDPPSFGSSRQEYWSGLPFPSPWHLPDPGIGPRSPALQADALLSKPLKMQTAPDTGRQRHGAAGSPRAQSVTSREGLEAWARLDQTPRICRTWRTHERSRDERCRPASRKPSWKRLRKLSLLQRQTAPSQKEFPTPLGCGLGEGSMFHGKAVCTVSGQENTALR